MQDLKSREFHHEYDLRMATHIIKDGNGRVVAEITDEQIQAVGAEVVVVLQGITSVFVEVANAAAAALKGLSDALGLKTTPYQASSFRSKIVQQARIERAEVETAFEVEQHRNPGIGMRAIQDRLDNGS